MTKEECLTKKPVTEKTKMPLTEENLNALQLSIQRGETPDTMLTYRLQYINQRFNPVTEYTTVYSSFRDNDSDIVINNKIYNYIS